ncbi:MAG: CotH kinase family protein [Prevotella sp.]|nr:CotH kinase family protein [Prevotella sp.]
MRPSIILLTVLSLAASFTHAANETPTLVINELMQSNIDCIMDDLNDFPDSWVELYNAGSTSVNLNQYKLGLSENANGAWQLPSQTVQPKQYVLIYCDKEASGLHTDFRIDSGKGGAYLFQDNTLVDKAEMKKQPAPNIAYGRKTDGADEWGYQLTPTPGKANTGEICDAKNLLGMPVFSKTGQVFENGTKFRLDISLPEGAPEGTVIRYTTDGSEPTATSDIFSSFYIEDTKVVRAKLFCDGYLSPRSTCHSYIFFPTNRQLTLPVISIMTNDRYLNDAMIGIYVDGTYQNGKKNYEFNWRRPINIEMFETAGKQSFINQLCETRIQGGATRSNKLKSLAIYANKRFGTKRFTYEFFPDQKPGLIEFKSLVLRNSGNDFDYLYNRDAIIQRAMAQNADLDWQAWRPAIIYINGKYRGMLNIRERSNEDNIYTNYDGLEDIDMFENWNELKEGTWDNYNAFKEFYAEHNHTLAEYAQWMDWEEFFNLMIMNLYFDNEDFPCNNIVMWRPRTENGKWRWIAKDTDFGLGLYGANPNYNTIAWVNEDGYDNDHNGWGNAWSGTRLFRRMMEDSNLKREFIDRCAIYMGDFLNEKSVRAIWDPMYNMIKTEYPYHRELFNKWWPNYSEELNNSRNWLKKRTDYFYEHLKNYYKLGSTIQMVINSTLANLDISFNGIKLTKGYFDGKFFQGREVKLEGTHADGQQVIGWTAVIITNNGTSTVDYEGSACTFTMPACSRLIINAKLGPADGIQQQEVRPWSWRSTGNQLTVSNVSDGVRVALYDLQGVLISESVSNGTEITLPLIPHRVYVLKVGSESIKIKN